MKRPIVALGGFALALASQAISAAEPIVLACTVKSGDPASILNFGGPGAEVIFKITDTQWLVWDEKAGKWAIDSCRSAGFFHADGNETLGYCQFGDTTFRSEINHGERNATMLTTQEINRQTGEWSVKSEVWLRGLGLETEEVRGDCELTAEPEAPPKPTTKF